MGAGDSVLIRFPGGGAPVVDAMRTRYQLETGSCIADMNGNLRLYANKDSIYSANFRSVYAGRVNITSEHTNGAIILPIAGDSNLIQVFYIGGGVCTPTGRCPRVATVKLGDDQDSVIDHRSFAINNPPYYTLAEKVAAVKDAGGTGWWVFYHSVHDNVFLRLHAVGSQVSPVDTQAIGSVHENVSPNPYFRLGEMCFSPRGDKLLAVTLTGIVDVFDFDRCTGRLSNWRELGSPAPWYPGPNAFYGCSFSPDGTKVFASENSMTPALANLYQWDLNAPNVQASKTIVGQSADSIEFGQHQLGPDGKIYIANLSYPIDTANPNNHHLSVINDPNQPGLACNFVYGGFSLGGRRSTLNLPNLPNFNLAPLVAQNAQAGPPRVVICPGDSVLLGFPDTTGGAVSFAWDAHPDISDTTVPQMWVHPGQSTWYYLTVTDSAVGIPCGVTRDSVEVVVVDSSEFVVASCGPDTVICAGDSVRLGVSVGQGSWGMGHGLVYDWSTGSDSATAVVSAAGVYSVTVTNPVGTGACFVGWDSVRVDTFPEPEFTEFIGFAGLDGVLCFGDSVSVGVNAGGAYDYLWSAGVVPGDSLNGWVSDTGSFVLSIFNPDSLGGCFIGTDTVRVVAFDSLLLPPGFAGNDSTVCVGDSLLLGIALPSNWVGSWSPAVGLQDPDSLVTLAWPPYSASYVLAATDTTNHGSCATVRDTVRVVVEDQNFPDYPNFQDVAFCPGEVVAVGFESVEGYSYAWSPVSGLQDAFVSATWVAPLVPVVYTLTVTNDTAVSLNCRTREFVVALSSDGCLVQNVVSPNGDGINDFLDLGTFNGPLSLSVYDRWGGVVFASDAYGNDWPSQDSRLPETVYYYVARVGGAGGRAFSGQVMVVR